MVDYVEKYLKNEKLQSSILGQGIIGVRNSPYDAGTASVSFHHTCGRGVHGDSPGPWGYIEGGMGQISFALCDIAMKYGAVVSPSTPVKKIIPGVGVLIDNDILIKSRVIVSNADPYTTLDLLGSSADPSWATRVKSIPIEGCTAKVNLYLKELPNFKSKSGLLCEHHKGEVNLPLTKEQWKKSFNQMENGLLPDDLWSEIYFQSAADPTIISDGKHTISLFVQYVPYKFNTGSWETRRKEVGEKVVKSLTKYCSNMEGNVMDMKVWGPPDIHKEVGLYGGHIFQGSIMPEYMYDKRLQYKTPMKNLYMCGASTYPGGGVMGINGRNAAMEILKEF